MWKCTKLENLASDVKEWKVRAWDRRFFFHVTHYDNER